MLRYTNYTTYSDRLNTAINTFTGGDIVAILLRQSMRIKALLKRRAAAQRTINAEPLSNPVVFMAGIPITVKQQETFNYSAEATRYPVESTAIISDHVILDPLQISISFEVSNWGGGDARYALDLIESLWSLRVPVDLLTEFKKIPNMVLVNFQGSNAVPEWGKLSGRATFQQIGLGVLQIEPYTEENVTPEDQTGGTDVSKSATPSTDIGVVSPKTSVLADIFGIKQ